MRFATNGEAVWFKAVGEPNLREFELTVLLSARLPQFAPQVLMTNPQWHAWTMLEVTGVPLSHANDSSAWCAAARALARMQIASIAMTQELLERHARDVRVPALLGQVKPFFEVMRDLIDRQQAAAPAPLSAEELQELELGIREALLDLPAQGIPDTIGHLDLNPDNIIGFSDRTVFLDWAEGCVGHPFLSFSYLLEFFSKRFPGDIRAKLLLIRSYAEPWQASGIVRKPAPSLTMCTLLAVFAHAISTDLWRDSQQIQKPGFASYYRSVVRRMKRYRDQIRGGINEVAGVPA
jgi:hypothetical protein